MSNPPDEPSRHVSSFRLELARLGEVSVAERAFIDEHLRSCPHCAEMAASFEAARREWKPALTEKSRALLVPQPRVRRWLALLGAGLLVPAAAGLLLFLSARHPPAGPGPEPDIGIKGGGGTAFLLAARRGARVFPVRGGEPLRPGDQIRFVLERVRHPYVLIASVDGAGRANVYVPYEGEASLKILQGQRVEIPGSIVIDDSKGPERIFALLSHRPLQAARVRAALAALGAKGVTAIRGTMSLDVGADEQVTILLEKVVR